MRYESVTVVQSKVAPGVSFTVAKMSFARRIELGRRIRELVQKIEFLEADPDPRGKMDAALLASEVDRIYAAWGLRAVAGLELDGEPATPDRLAEAGPEDLFREAVGAVKTQCGLSDAERKN